MITIPMISLTYANKSKKALEKSGYVCDIVHKVQSTGCEYTITVNGSKNDILKILNDNNIPIKNIF
ncbi:MAG: putative Se/S carrier-like protein [Oscillospiraceae bacterium]